jgi:hypothetical protein
MNRMEIEKRSRMTGRWMSVSRGEGGDDHVRERRTKAMVIDLSPIILVERKSDRQKAKLQRPSVPTLPNERRQEKGSRASSIGPIRNSPSTFTCFLYAS